MVNVISNPEMFCHSFQLSKMLGNEIYIEFSSLPWNVYSIFWLHVLWYSCNTELYRRKLRNREGDWGLWKRTSTAIKACDQRLKANRASDMNLSQAWRPVTLSHKSLGVAVAVLSSCFCPTLDDLLCLPSAQVHYTHLFHRYNALLSRSLLSLCRCPSIHDLNRAIDSWAGRDRIVSEFEDGKGAFGH